MNNQVHSNHSSNNLLKGRVIIAHKNKYVTLYNNEKYNLEVSGRFKYMAFEKSDYPVVGDYVNFRATNSCEGVIESIDERDTVIERHGMSNTGEKQLFASNVDLIFVCMALDHDYNIRKLLNFLSLTYDTGCEVVILFTKKDLCENPNPYIESISKYHHERIEVVSVFDEEDVLRIEEITKNKTSIFIGSSGVGKSSLINKLIGNEYFKTNDVRVSDSQGRHTTTHRELIPLKNGGSVIDTPGIRVVYSHVVDNLEDIFDDVESLASDCKFRDCRHNHEPGCKVNEALATGDLPYERYQSYLKIERLNRFNRRRDEQRQRLLNKRKR